jgi:aspartate-semialdehyde dehydrogenase
MNVFITGATGQVGSRFVPLRTIQQEMQVLFDRQKAVFYKQFTKTEPFDSIQGVSFCHSTA